MWSQELQCARVCENGKPPGGLACGSFGLSCGSTFDPFEPQTATQVRSGAAFSDGLVGFKLGVQSPQVDPARLQVGALLSRVPIASWTSAEW